MNAVSATRNARTMTTSAECQARRDSRLKAEEMGVHCNQVWLATFDSRTRPTHAAANGQEVDVHSPFIVGGYELKYPCDPDGPSHEVYNCRCTTHTGKITFTPLKQAYAEYREKYGGSAENGLTGGGKSGIIESGTYDSLSGLLGNKVSEKIAETLDNVVSVIPERHRNEIENHIKKVTVVPERGYCSYNRMTRELILDPDVAHEQIIHEYGHVFADLHNLYSDSEFLGILSDGLDLNDSPNILMAYIPQTNKNVYMIESPKFINHYQGRIYPDDDGLGLDQPIKPQTLREYISVGFDYYFKDPALLKEKDPKLFEYLERKMGNGHSEIS